MAAILSRPQCVDVEQELTNPLYNDDGVQWCEPLGHDELNQRYIWSVPLLPHYSELFGGIENVSRNIQES